MERLWIDQSSLQLLYILFFLASSYSYLDNNKLTSVPDLEGPKSINLL